MSNFEKQTKNAVESFALFRTESAIVIALTLILTSLSAMGANWIPGQWWMWLIGGIVAETALIANTFRDNKAVDTIEEDLFLKQLRIEQIKSNKLKSKVNKAFEYHILILKEVEEQNVTLSPELFDVIDKLDAWILTIYKLAQTLDDYQQDPVLKRDIENVPFELVTLKKKLARADGRVKQELEKAIATKEKHLKALRAIAESLERAELKIDNTLSAMGTVYTQIMNLGTQSTRAIDQKQLQNEIFEQIDVLEKMNVEVEKAPALVEA